jgi:hypothetical protein
VISPSSVSLRTRGSTWAPGDVPAFRLDRVADGGEPGGGGNPADQPGKQASGDGRVRRGGAFGVGRVDTVEPEDGVEVDQAAALNMARTGDGL